MATKNDSTVARARTRPTEQTWHEFFEEYGEYLDWLDEQEECAWAEEDA